MQTDTESTSSLHRSDILILQMTLPCLRKPWSFLDQDNVYTVFLFSSLQRIPKSQHVFSYRMRHYQSESVICQPHVEAPVLVEITRNCTVQVHVLIIVILD